jgi:ribosome-binding factor A
MPKRHSRREFPRTARLNALLQEILGDELERIDDDRLVLVTVTHVNCEADLRHATVSIDTLGGPEEDEALLTALEEVRYRLQAAIGRQTRIKRTPELRFVIDEVIRNADRIEQVLRGLEAPGGS